MAVYLGSNQVDLLGGDGIPSAYVIPSGTYSISSNGIYDIGSYKSVDIQGNPDWWSLFMTSMRSQVKRASNYSFQSLINFSLPSYFFAGANLQGSNWNFPLVTEIGAYCFLECFGAYENADVEFTICSIIHSSAFQGNYRLTKASFPACTLIKDGAFSECRNLATISFPNCITISDYAFYSCSNLTNLNFPSCTTIGFYAFAYCQNVAAISFPLCTVISTCAFSGCSNLTNVNFPSCTIIGNVAFRDCYYLTTASFPACSSIAAQAFSYCHNLISLNLIGISSVPTLGSSNAFYSTPIGGYSTSAGQYGSIYVPASLYNSFITANNWSLFSSRIVSV